tara:strand:+ start:496 stop:1479 length:984 start_codon:yes stop_codon:yes gene_type:complete
MKSSPFKIKQKSSPLFANGGVQIPTQPHKGEGTDSKVGRKKQSEIEYKDADEEFETVASFAPVTGEIIDAKNTVIDLKKGDYTGAAINAAGLGLPFLSGKVLKKMVGKGDATKTADMNTTADIGGVTKGKTKIPYNKDHKNQIFEIPGWENRVARHEAAENVMEVSNARGTDLDDWIASNKAGGVDFSKMDYSGSVTKLPSKTSGNAKWDFVEVDLPDGNKQIFYKSTGTGGKAGSKGEWIPFEGHAADGWFIKTGSRGKFNGEAISTKFTADGGSIGVYEQIKQKGLDPWEEIEKGNLKLDYYGQGFKYGSKEYVKIAEQLKSMDI